MDNIQTLLAERDRLWKKGRESAAIAEDWTGFRSVKNNIKTKTRQAKKCFTEKALSSNKQNKSGTLFIEF